MATQARRSLMPFAAHWPRFLRSAFARSRMARATGAGRGRRSGVGAMSFWQFARPRRTSATIAPSATDGFPWSSRNLLIAERYGCRLSAATVPRSPRYVSRDIDVREV